MDNLFQLVINDAEDEVFAVSFVADPAIERDFVYMSKEGKQEVKFKSIDDEKHLVAGPLLIPDKKILRMDENNQPYYVYFTADTISQLEQKYMMKKYNDSVTYEHTSPVQDVCLVESWTVASSTKDKSNIYGYTLPVGTWFGVFKLNNPDLWQDVKLGKVKGFSIEGIFDHKQVQQTKVKLDLANITDAEARKVLAKIKHIIKSDQRYKKGQRIDRVQMDGESGQPSVVSSYPGQFGPGKKKKAAGEYIHPALIQKKTI
jgi:hypothetical protein